MVWDWEARAFPVSATQGAEMGKASKRSTVITADCVRRKLVELAGKHDGGPPRVPVAVLWGGGWMATAMEETRPTFLTCSPWHGQTHQAHGKEYLVPETCCTPWLLVLESNDSNRLDPRILVILFVWFVFRLPLREPLAQEICDITGCGLYMVLCPQSYQGPVSNGPTVAASSSEAVGPQESRPFRWTRLPARQYGMLCCRPAKFLW